MLSHFSDFLVLSACAINEGQSLIQWLGQMDFKAVCVAGISKGGYLATVAGMRSPDSVRIVSVVAPHSGVAVLLEGLLGRLCDWDLLQTAVANLSRCDSIWLKCSTAAVSNASPFQA